LASLSISIYIISQISRKVKSLFVSLFLMLVGYYLSDGAYVPHLTLLLIQLTSCLLRQLIIRNELFFHLSPLTFYNNYTTDFKESQIFICCRPCGWDPQPHGYLTTTA
jgi:hypothetical protein